MYVLSENVFSVLRHILQYIRVQTCRKNDVANVDEISEVRLIIFYL